MIVNHYAIVSPISPPFPSSSLTTFIGIACVSDRSRKINDFFDRAFLSSSAQYVGEYVRARSRKRERKYRSFNRRNLHSEVSIFSCKHNLHYSHRASNNQEDSAEKDVIMCASEFVFLFSLFFSPPPSLFLIEMMIIEITRE